MTTRIATAARAVALSVACLLVASACTGGTTAPPPSAVASAAASTSAASPSPTPTASATASATTPAPLLAEGATGDKVRDLQARLKQLKHYAAKIDGSYGPTTTQAVKDFQDARALGVTGSVDEPTWSTLVAATKAPTAEELAGPLIPGPAILSIGSKGPKVRELQARLKQLNWWSGDVSDTYGSKTAGAVKGYQTKRGLPATGEVDQRTMDRLWGQTRKPTSDELNNVKPAPVAGAGGLDPRCLVGRVICASKAARQIVWVVDGVPQLKLDARFGRASLPTDEGVFRISFKSRDHWSTLYDVSMPLALFFSGGQAVHYSYEFASIGYGGVGSHGCINTRDRAKMTWLFDQARVGDLVIVY